MISDTPNPKDFLCSICGERIPYENDDTVVWPDVRYEQKESVSATGQSTHGPYLTAHPACFESVKPGFNAPCPLCHGALAPIPTLKPNVGRWACSACKHEFARNEAGNFVGDDA